MRQALETDAPALAALKQQVWPQEAAPTLANIVNALRAPAHVTHVATVLDKASGADEVVGFVSGFTTPATNGDTRWEVDLLAVHPAYRGQQLGTRLIELSTATGHAYQASLVRGLVAVDNLASQWAFSRCGYHPERTHYALLVATSPEGTPAAFRRAPATSFSLIPVQTLTYQGAWLEGVISLASLQTALVSQAAQGWAVVGSLIPVEQTAEQALARSVGFALVDEYQWWVRH